MAKININRNQSPKRKEKARRKRLFRECKKWNDIAKAVNQLSPIDAARILDRATKEAGRQAGAIQIFQLAYKHTCELLNTVAV